MRISTSFSSPAQISFANPLFFRLFRFHQKMPIKKCRMRETRPYTAKSNFNPTRSSYPLLKAGTLAAHRVYRLMLLGPPSDMVHSSQLRKTRLSTQRIGLIRKESALMCGIYPCCSGFQVQGSAKSPAGMASFHSSTLCTLYYNRLFPFLQGIFKNSYFFQNLLYFIHSIYAITAASICAVCSRVSFALASI